MLAKQPSIHEERQSRPLYRKKASYSQYLKERKRSETQANSVRSEDSMKKIFRESSHKYLNARKLGPITGFRENKYARLRRLREES